MNKIDNTVDHASINLEETVRKVFKAATKLKTSFTKADIQLQTGLSLFKVEDALYVLMEKYACKLSVNEKGQIIYFFDWSALRKPEGFKEILLKISSFTKHLIVFLLKLIITIAFFSYALTIGVILALVIAIIAKSPQPIVVLFVALFEAVKMMFTDINSFFTNEKKPIKKSKENLIAMIFDFAFGSNRSTDELAQEKQILEYIRLNQCKITASDLTMITGWDINKSKEELTLMLTQYRGKVEVSDDGVLIYYFPEFEPQKSSDEKLKSFFIWNNLLELLPYNDNKKTDNRLIKGVAVFSLIVASIIMIVFKFTYHLQLGDFLYLLNFSAGEQLGLFSKQALTITIAFYSFLFFTFFIIASSISKRKNKKLNNQKNQKNIYYKNLQNIFAFLPKIELSLLNNLTEDAQFNLSQDMQGELKSRDEDAVLYYDFSFLELELKSAEKQRKGQKYPNIEKVNSDEFQKLRVHETKKHKPLAKLKFKKLKFRFKHAFLLLVVAAITFRIYFNQEIRVIKYTGDPEGKDLNTRIIADHSSILYPFFTPENYSKYKRVIIKNASKERPVPVFDNNTKTRKLEIYNADCDIILPDTTEALSKLIFHNVKGKIVLPKKIDFEKFEAKNINSELHFPNSISYANIIHIQNNNMQPVYLPQDGSITEIYLEGISFPDTALHFEIYDNLTKLSIINTDLNPLKYTLYFGEKIKDLILRNTNLNEIPQGLEKLTELYKLDLSQNNIEKLPYNMYISLSTLNLSQNKIKELPYSIWNYDCHDLYLDSNQISQLPAPYSNQRSRLTSLYFSYNKLSSLPTFPESIRNNVINFDLSHNNFKEFPNELFSFSKLTTLNLSANKISSIPASIEKLNKLSKLHISYNPIQSVSASLKELNKSYNSCRIFISVEMEEAVIRDIRKYAGAENVYIE